MRYGRVESVKILPKRGSEGGVAAFVDFVDIKSAQKAHNSVNKMGDRDLRTDYNEPGTIPSAARGLDDTVSIASRSREVSGFRGGGGGPAYGPPPSLHAREGRYERRLDGASDNRERAYEHSAYGHHERGTGGFDRTRHYDQDYYRDPRERTLQHGLYYTSRSRSPNRFDAHDPRYEPRAREQFTLPSVVHRDIYRDDITRERLASQASRPTRSPSGSGSRSRSSSSDSISSSSSTSSDSTDSSSSSSDDSPARSVQSAAVPAPTSQLLSSLEKDEPRKSFGIKQEDQEKALTASKGKLFFGMQIEVTAWIGPETESENEFRPLDERIDEFHPKATRTLFIGNLEKTTTYHDLRNIFQRFGEIVDIDIKKVNGVPQYAFLQYCDIASVCKAIKKMDGEYLGNNRLKLGFGKSMPTNCVWLDGLSSNVSDQYLTRHFCRYGPVVKVVFDRLKGMALVLYNEIEYAQAAVKETKGRKIGGNKIKVDFANRESQLAFYHCMEKSGQDIRDFYEMLAERSSQSSETDQENEREQSPEKSRSSNKLSREKADKEGLKAKLDNDTVKSSALDQKLQEKGLSSHVEVADKEGRPKPRKHLKPEQSADGQPDISRDVILLREGESERKPSYRKQMEQSRRKQQMEMEIAKSEKFGSPKKDVDEYERRSLVHEVGKPPQDVTDDSPPSKKKRMDHVDFDISTKRERNYRSSRQISEDSERTGGSPSIRHGSFHEDDDPIGSPRLMREQMADMAKIKLSVLNSEDELNRWDSQTKQDASKFDVESSVEPEPDSSQTLSKPAQKPEEADEPKVEKPDSAANVEPNANPKAEAVPEVPPQAPEDAEADPPVAAKDKKPNKSKRSKTPVQAAAASMVEKPVTRKSERIDREKLKRSNSPRGEAQKLLELKMEAEKITRTASKNMAADPEHPEPSLPLSRTRRRNVRSVYATMGDHESRSPVKEPVEQPRVTRKRLERELQEAAVVPTTPRRGRPPKTRRRADEDDETEAKEPVETVKPAEGWRSPRSQKVAAGGQQGKRGKNEPKVDAERPEATTEVGPQVNVKENNTKSKADKEEAGSEQKRDKKEIGTDRNPPEAPPVEVVEKKTAPEKNSKSKRGRSRNSRSAVDKSANLKNLEATVSPSVAAGPAGPPVEKEAGVVAVSPEKSESPQKEGSLSSQLNSEPADLGKEPEKEEDVSASKPSPEANQLAKQMELEQAVENIEKLTETSAPAAFKAAATDAPEGLSTEDGDKPAHQASETELAAAIGSIINDISGEPENFPAPPPFPAESQTDLQPPEEGMEPETDEAVSGILETEVATESSRPPGSAPDPTVGPADTKEAKESGSETSLPVPEAKGSKEAEVTLARKDKGRQKTSRSRRKRNTSKKTGGAAETHVSEPDQVQSKSPAANEGATIPPLETPQEEKQSDGPQSTPSESCASDPGKTPSMESLSQESSVEEKTPTKASALPDLPPPSQPAPVDDEPQARFRVHSIIESDPVTPPSDSSMPTPTIPSVTAAKLPPPITAGGVPHQSPPPKVTEWITRQEEPRAQSTPSPALPPDTKASDIDTSSSTLRKILMDPKYVSATGVTSTSVTTAIAEPVSATPCLHETLPPPVESKKPLLEEKPAAPVTNTSDTQASEVPVAADKEKVTPVIAPKITSVISRMPVSIDLENSQKITLAKPAPQTLTGLVSALTGLVNVSLVPVNALTGPVNALKGPVKGSVATLKGLVNTPAGPVNVLKGPVNVLTGPVNVLTTPVNAATSVVNAATGAVNAATGAVNASAGAVTVTAGAVTSASGGVTATTAGAVTVAGAVIAPSKCKQRPSATDNSRFHPGSMSVIDERPADTGSGAGLRVNTSEGVVLLSYSGQKTEGPQRISAKISQIPPASAMDIEFQQSVSKSQVKPDSVTPSQPPPKGPQAPSGYANVATHSTLVLTAQTYNASPVISSVKADRPSLEKPEPIHLSVSTPVTQGGTVKVLTQGINTPPVLVHNQLVLTPSIVTTNKKLADPVTLKIETKVLQPANLGSTLTPHHPPALPSKLPSEVNHVTSGPTTPTDRTVSHLAATKPDAHSPRPSGPAPSPFPRACQPSSTTSTALSTNATVMLAAGIPVPQFISSIHPEQSVIMPPHSITQTVSLSHLSQGEVRMNTPTLPSITYSIRPETLHSPRAPLQPQQIEVRAPQRAGTPQPATAGVPALASQHPPEEEVHYHLPVARATAPVQSEVLVMQSEYRLHPYTVPRDVRIMVHPHVTAVSEQPRAADGVVKVPPASKTPQQPGKEAAKTADAKAAPAPTPHSEARILTVTPSNQLQGLPLTPPVVVTHGVQIVHSSGELFQEYRYGDIRTYHGPAQLTHTQFPAAASIGLPSRTKAPAQAAPKQPLFVPTTSGPSTPPGLALPLAEAQPAPKQDSSPHLTSQRPVDMVQLLKKYPIVWQGLLALKNDTAAVQLHFVSGNNVLAHRSLPLSEGGPPLRIAQRMRLEASQLEGVARRMTVETDYCLLLALPCGRDQEDVVSQTESLKAAFITYLQAKQAAGIINVPNPGSNQPAYVLQIFPPCEFSESHLSRLAPDLLASISNISPHLMIVIASV
ncbi:msx2-interacting protein [Camelus ferus]|nr:msx2-interacting protein [Camelus ferus]